MKNAILESFLFLSCCILFGSSLFFIACPAWLQWSFFAMQVTPALIFIPKIISFEMKK